MGIVLQGGDGGRKREERNEFKVKCVGFIFSRRRRSKDSVRAKGRSGRLSGFQRVGMSAAGLAFPRLSGGYSSKVQNKPRYVPYCNLYLFDLVYFRVENGQQQVRKDASNGRLRVFSFGFLPLERRSAKSS